MQADPRGAYYTPADIVSLIVENTVGRLLRESAPGLPADPAILDPACGNGAFLAGAYSYLHHRYSDPESRRQILSCIYGADVDKVALDEAGRSLTALSGAQAGPSANLRHGDSLIAGRKGINWRRDFPKVMARGGFDAVIGNPPWVSLAGRFGVRAYSESEIGYLRKRFGGNSYLPNTFEYFVSLGLDLTRPGGYFSFIVPDRLGFNQHFEHLRRRLLSETELLLLVHGVPFPGVVADTLIFVCRKGAPGPDAVTEVRDWRGASNEVRQSELLQSPGCEFRRHEDPRITRVIRRMESLAGMVRLRDICDITSGFGGKSALITESRISDAQTPVLKGDSIERYAVRKTYWFDFRKENRTGRTCDTSKLGSSPKILIRKTGGSLIAAYDESGAFPEQSLYFLFNNRTDLDYLFILGILNSRLMGIYYRARCLNNLRTIAHAKISDLAGLPFPALPDDRRPHDAVARLVRRMLEGDAGAQSEADRLICGLYGVQMQDLRAIIE